jgi:pimeloyl-ACP methyl ester carboxylesterase
MERFAIAVPDEVLTDLKRRLESTRWPDQLDRADWDYGTEITYLQELCAYWRDAFDWRAQEERLNAFDQFRTPLDGVKLHFIHQRSKEHGAMPLVITHGWPGSIAEFTKIIGPLTDPVSHGAQAEDAFHVVCPSIPGYGFSEAPRERGWDVRRVAGAVQTLMAELGYTRYGAQGGDWGSAVTAWLGAIDEDHVAGIHLNMVAVEPPPGTNNAMSGLSPDEARALLEREKFGRGEVGYRQIQSTKPQTLGYGLNDSPAGLAAWIVEKFRTWSDCGGDVESVYTKDELLTNIMIYWVTATITSSTRLYYETRASKRFRPERVRVPTGCALFPKELYCPPRAWVERVYNVQRWAPQRRGGHFAAMEQPEALVTDIREFFRNVR